MTAVAANNKETPTNSPPIKRKSRWKFRLVAITFPFVMFLLAEGILRLCDIGPNVNLIVNVRPETTSQPEYTHQFNGAVDLAFFGQTDVGGPEERPFILPRPKDTYRIVVLGGSTVIGFPYAPALAFPRHIECQLQQQNPEQKIEVLNAGITAMNSFAVNDLVGQCIAAEPNLIVIHTGHNEFYGPGGPASKAFSLPPSVIRQCYYFRRWRSVQLLTSLTGAQNQLADDLLDTLPRQLEIPLNGDVYKQARTNYESNLRRMLQTCESADVPVLLTTVACNLRDQSPLLSTWPNKSTDGREQWASLLERASNLLEAGDFNAALDVLDEAATLTPEHADLSYRRGQCYYGLGQNDKAWAEFSRARDLDSCRFRIPSEFHDVPAQLASEFDNCEFLNMTDAMIAAGHNTPPGYDIFLEHVHYTFEGHELVGQLMAKAIQSNIRKIGWNGDKAPQPDELKELLGFLPEDDIAATSFAMQVFETGPFMNTLDKQRHIDHLTQRTAQIFESLPETRANIFADLKMTQMSHRLLFHLATEHRNKHNDDFVIPLRDSQQRRTPWAPLSPGCNGSTTAQ